MWRRHLEQDDSPVSDLFGGQLQGNITCHSCKGRFTRYEFFKVLGILAESWAGALCVLYDLQQRLPIVAKSQMQRPGCTDPSFTALVTAATS